MHLKRNNSVSSPQPSPRSGEGAIVLSPFHGESQRGGHRQRGLSLIEVIVVIVVVGIIFSIGALVMRLGFSAYFGGENITTQDWQSRVAFERMTRDLRDGHSNTNVATSGVAGDMAINLSIYDSASATISNVTYARSGNTLQRNSIALADNVTALDFALLQSNGTAAASSTYYIQATLTVSTVGDAKGDYNLTFRDTINPRNFP